MDDELKGPTLTFFDFSRIFVNYVDGHLLPEGGRELSMCLIKGGANVF